MCGGNKPVEIQSFHFEFLLRGTRTDVLMDNSRTQNSYGSDRRRLSSSPGEFGAMGTYRLWFWFVFVSATSGWCWLHIGVVLQDPRASVKRRSRERYLISANCSILGPLYSTPLDSHQDGRLCCSEELLMHCTPFEFGSTVVVKCQMKQSGLTPLCGRPCFTY